MFELSAVGPVIVMENDKWHIFRVLPRANFQGIRLSQIAAALVSNYNARSFR